MQLGPCRDAVFVYNRSVWFIDLIIALRTRCGR